jgi:leucyl/phenylalanyl-tRNA--protein transferase
VPVEPAASAWVLEPPPAEHPEDLWAIGADLAPGTILAAYRLGLFPMQLPDGRLGWWSPVRRGVVPLDARPPRTLRRVAGRYEIRHDTAFREVLTGCADPARPHGWITPQIREAFGRLHELGWAHAVEAWDEQGLAGGLYGVEIGGLFAAESMFQLRPDAAKASLLALVELLAGHGDAERRVLDVQWRTPHLALLGAVELDRGAYVDRLGAALGLPPVLTAA